MKKTLFFMALATAMLTSTSCSNASKEDVAGQHNIQVTKVSNYLYETTLDYDYDIDEGKELIEKNEPVMAVARASVSATCVPATSTGCTPTASW